ncbi:DEKNAAC102312 [Brettanomyces naardenensis]|uniref:DEKNAAC102312 n=1 Tax=Brettanomyces naardenensis TaxID=13370 RepID=A0A448YL77_BRENA|nr:DEKNAAC102312 [Brettanomyces naardenensis]
MTLKTIYIVRHGYRSNWLPVEQQVPSPTGVDSDPPLAPHGVDQANQLADFVAEKLSPKPELIFSSPFYRCVETITPTADRLDLDIFPDRGIGEWYKPTRGIIPIPAGHKILSSFFSRVSDDWNWNTVVPLETGETEEQIFNRCKVFWDRFFLKLEKSYPDVETILLATHAATKIALGMSLMGYDSNRDFLGPENGGDGKTTIIESCTCSLDKYSLNLNTNVWNLKINGETKYLVSGAEMNWHYCTSQFEAGSKEDVEARMQQEGEGEGEACPVSSGTGSSRSFSKL